MRRVLLLGLPLAFLSSACTYDNGDARRILDESSTCPDGASTIAQRSIDVDAKLEALPGQGAGVFIEYAQGGHWTLRTACDVAVKSSAPCAWDIIVTPEDGRSISNVAPQDLEADTDSLRAYPEFPRSYQLIAETSDDLDGFTFDTEPGTAIEVDALLDGICALPNFFWVEDGVVQPQGSPSNPLQLVPAGE